MKDRVFSAPTVSEAMNRASRELGIAAQHLRHVVLHAGAPSRPGLAATPAQVAVFIEIEPPTAVVEPRGETRPSAVLRELIELWRRASGLDLDCELFKEEGTLRIRLAGLDAQTLGESERAAARALEHVLQCVARGRGAADRVVIQVEGYQEHREANLRQQARAWGERVRSSGEPFKTEPLNAYERRLVHVELAESEDLTTHSVGEGRERRVVIERRFPAKK